MYLSMDMNLLYMSSSICPKYSFRPFYSDISVVGKLMVTILSMSHNANMFMFMCIIVIRSTHKLNGSYCLVLISEETQHNLIITN